jgi:MFS family permease
MVCVLPLFFFTGVQMTMWSGWFTRQMYKTVIGLVRPPAVVARWQSGTLSDDRPTDHQVMVGFGLSEFVGCFIIGPIGDKYGRAVLITMGTVLGTTAVALTWWANGTVGEHCKDVPCDGGDGFGCPCEDADYTYFYIAGVLYGLTDCSFQTVTGAICASDFIASGQASDAFALYRTFQSLGGVRPSGVCIVCMCVCVGGGGVIVTCFL